MSFSHDSRNTLVGEQRIFPVITLLFLNTSGERGTRKFGQWGTWSPCFTDAPRGDAMKRTRRNHGAAFKTQVAFAAGQGEKTLAELAPQFGVPPTQTTEWKPQLLVLSCVRRRARPKKGLARRPQGDQYGSHSSGEKHKQA